MRTAQRDQSATITFGAQTVDAAGGSGVAQPGSIPYTFTRTATGTYSYAVDPRLRVIFGTAAPATGSYSTAIASLDSVSAGGFRLLLASGGAASNQSHSWQVAAVDKRA